MRYGQACDVSVTKPRASYAVIAKYLGIPEKLIWSIYYKQKKKKKKVCDLPKAFIPEEEKQEKAEDRKKTKRRK